MGISPPPSNPFWDFSLAFYAQPGVPPASLDLQDRLGLDVNLLFFALWAGAACGVALSGETLARVDSAVAGWREEVVRPLRAVRRRVKGEDAALYDRLKAAELAAERLQQDRLFAVSGIMPGNSANIMPGKSGGVALAAANLRLLVPVEDASAAALLSALARLPRAKDG